MTRHALSIRNEEDISKLIKEEIHTLDAWMVDREECENPENGWKQLIPYVMFYCTNIEDGRVRIVQYRRPDKGEGEERLKGATSVGFGGHIDLTDRIEHDSRGEDGSYKMTASDLIETITLAARREIKEELKLDASSGIEYEISPNNIMTIKGQRDSEVSKSHICFGCFVPLDEETFNKLLSFAKDNFDKEEIAEVDVISINFGDLVASFNVKSESEKLTLELLNSDLEDWSVSMVNVVVISVASVFTGLLDWNDIKRTAMEKNELLKKEFEEANKDEVDQAPEDAVLEETEVVNSKLVEEVVETLEETQ